MKEPVKAFEAFGSAGQCGARLQLVRRKVARINPPQ